MAEILLLDLTLPTLPENLALDEALLLKAEQDGTEVLRFWEWPQSAVVLGAGCKLAEDVNEERCRTDDVQLARRSSGGGTVLLGPGCFLYSLVLSYERAAELADVRPSYRWILERMAHALAPLELVLHQQGTSDLVHGNKKVSGNAQQRKRDHVLHHGSLLYGFDIAGIEGCLLMPQRQPEYRDRRGHADFLANLPGTAADFRRLLTAAWQAASPLETWPRESVDDLVREKYSRDDWVRRR